VIVSLRYPRDAELRFSQQHDCGEWSSRLRIVGADFRTARDAFQLVITVKRLLKEWTDSPLHILINNAAQTLTDSIKAETKAIAREEQLHEQPGSHRLLADVGHSYEPRVRGGMQATWVSGIEGQIRAQLENGLLSSSDEKITTGKSVALKGLAGGDEETIGKSSIL
jgi:hypothetical protein